jgi:phosphoglycolate phosphatase
MVRRTIGLGLGEALEILTGQTDPELELRFRKLFVEHADEIMVSQTDLLEGVLPALDALRGVGLRLGIVSTKFRYRIEDTLVRYEALDRFEAIVGGGDVKALKPDPEGLLLSLKLLGVSAGEAVFVGDHLVDAEAAQGAGVPFVAVLSGTTDPAAFSRFPNVAILGGVADLPDFLETEFGGLATS